MKAIVYRTHGSADVLRYEEIEKPPPGDREVLLKVRAASLNPLDWRLIRGVPVLSLLIELGKEKLKRPGVDVAGEVEAVGRNVTRFKPGDEVFGACPGGFAEYACAKESGLAVKPDNVTFEQAACVGVAGLTALQGLRDKGKIRPGQKVLINGASGGVGTFAVQIAKSLGAEVTGVCSGGNVDLVRSLGADQVIDYTCEDFTRSGRRHDVILDNVGNQPFSACRRVLNPSGILVNVGGPKSLLRIMTRILGALVLSRFVSQTIVVFMARMSSEDLGVLSDLMKAGKVTPVIDRQYKLSEISEAMGYAEAGHARGKVVVTVA